MAVRHAGTSLDGCGDGFQAMRALRVPVSYGSPDFPTIKQGVIMDAALWATGLAGAAFFISHLGLAHPPVHDRIVGRIGEKGFQGVYLLATLVTLGGMIAGYIYAPHHLYLWIPGPGVRHLPLLIMPLAFCNNYNASAHAVPAFWLQTASASAKNCSNSNTQEFGQAFANTWRALLDDLALLSEKRSAITAVQLSAQQAIDFYSQLNAKLIAATQTRTQIGASAARRSGASGSIEVFHAGTNTTRSSQAALYLLFHNRPAIWVGDQKEMDFSFIQQPGNFWVLVIVVQKVLGKAKV